MDYGRLVRPALSNPPSLEASRRRAPSPPPPPPKPRYHTREQGLWGSNITASLEPTISHTFVTALFKGASGAAPGHFALKGGDAQQGPLQVYWDGPRPHGYAPMKKQGGLILGVGGDNSDGSTGTFCSSRLSLTVLVRALVLPNPFPHHSSQTRAPFCPATPRTPRTRRCRPTLWPRATRSESTRVKNKKKIN